MGFSFECTEVGTELMHTYARAWAECINASVVGVIEFDVEWMRL